MRPHTHKYTSPGEVGPGQNGVLGASGQLRGRGEEQNGILRATKKMIGVWLFWLEADFKGGSSHVWAEVEGGSFLLFTALFQIIGFA